MHERARTETPFGTTIAHGFLTLSLVSALMRDARHRRRRCGWRSTTASIACASSRRCRPARASARGSRSRRLTTWRTASRRSGTSPSSATAATSRPGRRVARPLLSGHVRGVTTPDTRPVRAAEQLDWPRLEAWLREQLPASAVPGLDDRERMQVEQFPGGHSNLTYLVRFGGDWSSWCGGRRSARWPRPRTTWRASTAGSRPSIPSFHWRLVSMSCARIRRSSDRFSTSWNGDMASSFATRSRAPSKTCQPCGAASASRWSMRSPICTRSTSRPPDSRISANPTGSSSGRCGDGPSGGTDRRRTSLPEMEALAQWLVESLPPNPARPAIVHGDFKLDNLMLDRRTPPARGGVRLGDGALGDPLVDLGILLAYWVPTAPPEQRDALTTVTTLPGWFTPGELIERYAARSGRDLTRAEVLRGVRAVQDRGCDPADLLPLRERSDDDPRFANFGDRVTYLARRAQEIKRRSSQE